MDLSKTISFGIMTIVWIFLFVKVYYSSKQKNSQRNTTKFITRVAIFGAISALLYIFIKFPVPFFPSFLEFHFDEIPVFIAGFAYGPLTAFCVLLLKTVIKLPFSTTLCVGEFADLLYSCAFVLPAILIYKKHRNFRFAMIGILIGTFFQLIVSLLINIYVMIPFYMSVMQLSEQAILQMVQQANPNISDLNWTFGLFAVLPFNAIKDVSVVIITIFTYKSTHRFFDKLQK